MIQDFLSKFVTGQNNYIFVMSNGDISAAEDYERKASYEELKIAIKKATNISSAEQVLAADLMLSFDVFYREKFVISNNPLKCGWVERHSYNDPVRAYMLDIAELKKSKNYN